jgi:hypothetical protein
MEANANVQKYTLIPALSIAWPYWTFVFIWCWHKCIASWRTVRHVLVQCIASKPISLLLARKHTKQWQWPDLNQVHQIYDSFVRSMLMDKGTIFKKNINTLFIVFIRCITQRSIKPRCDTPDTTMRAMGRSRHWKIEATISSKKSIIFIFKIRCHTQQTLK